MTVRNLAKKVRSSGARVKLLHYCSSNASISQQQQQQQDWCSTATAAKGAAELSEAHLGLQQAEDQMASAESSEPLLEESCNTGWCHALLASANSGSCTRSGSVWQRSAPAANLRAKAQGKASSSAAAPTTAQRVRQTRYLLEQKSGQSEQRCGSESNALSSSGKRARLAPLICPASAGAA